MLTETEIDEIRKKLYKLKFTTIDYEPKVDILDVLVILTEYCDGYWLFKDEKKGD